jgi:hypothetical protein
MDLKTLKEVAVRETERALAERFGVAPDPDSDEFEDEYRRQFELAKKRDAAGVAAGAGPVLEGADALPRLQGTPADERWAQTIRAQRLKEVRDKELRAFLIGAWSTSKAWIDSRELPQPQFLRRIEVQLVEHRRRAAAQSGAAQAAQRADAEAAEALQRKVRNAGITAQALVELIDLSERQKPTSLGDKLADLVAGTRSLRIFLSEDEKRLVVLEKDREQRRQYAITRDDGLIGDLKLYAQSEALKRPGGKP